ncbi:hypothetical protein PISL3812_00976 [Talaromyces islandicus]|uniref:Zn(2)-C6 fungal-type domain-containing protein n=1 Tax=Talaromyces islandicus TaxID=28573 RepID=A0A0U1LLG6_TALIS|nr:hypothetical protein PISL3812_00976 [Talaromyces islandicus]
MAETGLKTSRAKFVCHACNVRKKACNKALPTCSFCASRNLHCRYDVTVLGKGQRKYNPGRSFVALEPPSPPWAASASSATSISSVIPVPETPVQDSTDTHFIDRSVKQQVLSIVKLAGRTPEDVSDYYFETFQHACPIVSPQLFKVALTQYSRANDVSPADFSILLLTMYLITALPCLDRPLQLPPVNRDWLYATTKSLFAQAHATVSNSLHLVQAAFFIAVCEYACARPQAAYVSINTCQLLAETLGIEKATIGTLTSQKDYFETQQADIEKRNLASAIATFERIILIELDLIKSPPRTECPGMQSWAPLQLEFKYNPESEPPISPVSSSVGLIDDDIFEGQAQVISLLDNILRTIQSISERSKKYVLSELANLDVKLRNHLGVMMLESSKRQNSLCAPVALSVSFYYIELLFAFFQPATIKEINKQRQYLKLLSVLPV